MEHWSPVVLVRSHLLLLLLLLSGLLAWHKVRLCDWNTIDILSFLVLGDHFVCLDPTVVILSLQARV